MALHPADVPDVRAKELLTVMALAEYGSFVAAAAYLKTSQPALTRTVKRVERVLGVTLFARNTRRVEITAAGREFVAVAERILNDLQLTVRNMSEVTNEQRGRVTVSTYSAFAAHTLPDFIRRYRETRPSIELRIREGRQSEIIEDVRSGVADFGVGYVNSLPDTLQSAPLRREPLYAILPTAHPLAAKKRPRVRLAELRDEPLVTPPSDTYLRRLVDGAAAAAGFSLRYAVTVERLLSVTSHVRAGVGIAILPWGVLPPQPWNGFVTAMLVEPTLTVLVGLITLRGRYMTPAATSMMTLIKEEMAKAGGKVEEVEKWKKESTK
jgi:DNA-binding transcriptional LysR family regulator